MLVEKMNVFIFLDTEVCDELVEVGAGASEMVNAITKQEMQQDPSILNPTIIFDESGGLGCDLVVNHRVIAQQVGESHGK